MISILVEKINGTSFSGTVSDEDLSAKQIITLGIILGDYVNEVKFIGELSYSIDSDYIEVIVESITLINGDKEIELDQHEYDFDTLCNDLENGPHVSDWYADKESALIDHYYDSYRDNQFEQGE